MNKEEKALLVNHVIKAIITNIYPDKLDPVIQAEREAWQASQQLGMNAQIQAQLDVNTSIDHLTETLGVYTLDKIINRIEAALGVETNG